MTVELQETIINNYDENKTLINSRTSLVYLIKAGDGRVLKNKLTGESCGVLVCVQNKNRVLDYEEVVAHD